MAKIGTKRTFEQANAVTEEQRTNGTLEQLMTKIQRTGEAPRNLASRASFESLQ
jgi:hypothetical protein